MKANRKMSWELVKEAEKPKILWARIAQVHEDTEVAQIAVKFDTEQVSLSLSPSSNLSLSVSFCRSCPLYIPHALGRVSLLPIDIVRRR